MTKVKQINPNLLQEPAYPVINGELFIVPNAANRCLKDEEKEYKKSLGINFIFDSSGSIADERKETFGEDLTYEPYVHIWAHNAPEEGEDSNWTDHGIPEEVQEKAGIKFQRDGWRDGLFYHSIPYEWVKGKKEGDHLYLEYTDKGGNKCFFDMICRQKEYRYESHGDFSEVVKSVMAKGGFAL